MIEEVREILEQALQLGERSKSFDANTRLLGELPELDSMAVVTIITSLEDNYGFVVEDDDISAETFLTLGSLTEFVEQKTSE
jgi:acyl carrier protein